MIRLQPFHIRRDVMAIHLHPWKFDLTITWKTISAFAGACVFAIAALKAGGPATLAGRIQELISPTDNLIDGFAAHCEQGSETAVDYFKDPSLRWHNAFEPDGKPIDANAAKRHPGKGVVVWYQFSVIGASGKYTVSYRLREAGKTIGGYTGDVDLTGQKQARVSKQFFIMPVPDVHNGDRVTVVLSSPGADERQADAAMIATVLEGAVAWR